MVILHIEHPISDFTVWAAAFTGFADRRRQSGVRGERVSRPIDDEHYVVIDLDFDSADQASRFLEFLRSEVWANPQRSPALAGSPSTRILEAVNPAPAG
jgi:hypothetical protein